MNIKNKIDKLERENAHIINAAKEEGCYDTIYRFIIKGSSKKLYTTEVNIDEFNGTGFTSHFCTCPHFEFRALECKHIIKAKEVLTEWGIEEVTAKDTNLSMEDQSTEML